MKLAVFRMSNQFWDLVRSFYDASRSFRKLYRNYERRVLHYADTRGVDRRLLRLDGEEVAGLLDFPLLDRLVSQELVTVKTISANIFRSPTSTDSFDRTIAQIYHEMSILREEQYKVSRIAPAVFEADQEVYDSIIAEVHEMFPRQVHGINDLMKKAQARLEKLFPYFNRDRITLRSVYLFGDEVFDGFYPNGFEDVLELMFAAEGGPWKGLLEVAKSFLDAGFVDKGLEALECTRDLPIPAEGDEQAPLISAIQIEVDELRARMRQRVSRSKQPSPTADAARPR
ncbi:MAG: hypothetical protein ACYTFT_01715 [Planctomycetota bacterium]|jgi:hypothetical protein